LTIDEITNFCQFKGCEVYIGSPEAGFVGIDGGGIQRRNNYHRYLAFNELASQPSAREVLQKASIFKLKLGEETRTMERQEFEKEMKHFQRKLGLE